MVRDNPAGPQRGTMREIRETRMAKDAGHAAAEGSKGTSESKEQRACSVCGTKLSSYNPGPNCWQHTIGYPWRGPSAKPRYD